MTWGSATIYGMASNRDGKKKSAEAIAKRTATRRANGGFTVSDEWRAAQSMRVKEIWAKRKAAHVVA